MLADFKTYWLAIGLIAIVGFLTTLISEGLEPTVGWIAILLISVLGLAHARRVPA
jgi:hypothetical protein